MRAAIEEGNALGRARIIVPDLRTWSGSSFGAPGPVWSVTGHLSITGDPTARVGGAFSVEAGASLQVQGLRTHLGGLLAYHVVSGFEVHGTLILNRSSIGRVAVGEGGC